MEDPGPPSGSQSQSQQPPSTAAGGPHIRSRVTVVCAECKRLKLKCDRRTPCASCTKRDTVARCVYSAAAAEKVDLHSLNNRLVQVESQLAQFSASGRIHGCPSKARCEPATIDRFVFTVGKSGSSLALSFDDIAAIWLQELDVGRDAHALQNQSWCPPSSTSSQLKTIEPVTGQELSGLELPVSLLLPSPSTYFLSPSPAPNEVPAVTPRLMAHLPFAPRRRQKLYDNVEDVLKMHPCFNFKHFKDRAEAMFRWAAEGDNDNADAIHPDVSSSSQGGPQSTSQKADLARAIFFGSPTPRSPKAFGATQPTVSFFAAVAAAFALGMLIDREVADEEARIIAVHTEGTVGDSSARPPSRRRQAELPNLGRKCKGIQKDAASSPAVLLALSQQALSMFEKSNLYDLDFLVTMILHVLYTLHDSKARAACHLLPDVGKMVNIARTMGLDVDPEEFPGTFNLFEAELRRRLWWDISYYDVFVSDYMGRAPLISDTEHTTRFPMDVDEDVFTPACKSVPLPRSPLSPLEPNASDFKYFGLKCRLVQLIKDIKMRSFKDSLQNDPEAQEQYSLTQAMACASEIKQWLTDLPSPFRLDIDPDPSCNPVSQHDACNLLTPPSLNDNVAVSPVLLAQRCELMVTAQRLIMKIYIPFLRPSNNHSSSTTHYQATVGIFTAAHTIIRSIKVLCSMWKQRPDLKGKRPTPALFRFYSFARTLFDATVACAHNVIKDPTSVWVRTAIEDVNYGLEVMRDPMMNTGRGPMRGGVEGDVHEAIGIVELLLEKAEAVRRGDVVVAGTKRKRDDGDADPERPGSSSKVPFACRSTSPDLDCPPLLTPHLGPSIAVSNPIENPKSKDASSVDEPSNLLTPPALPLKEHAASVLRDPKCKHKHAKKTPPQSGIRLRPGKQGPPYYKIRSPSSSSGTPESTTESTTLVSSAPQPCQTPSTPASKGQPYASQPPFARPMQRPPSANAVKMYAQKASQDGQNDRNVDSQAPFGDSEQVQGPAGGHLNAQSQQYLSAESTESQHLSKMPPRSAFEQSRSMSYQGNSYPGPPPYAASGPGSMPCRPMSRPSSSHHSQPTTYAAEVPVPSQHYFQYNSRFEGDVNDASLVDLGISPSMTLRTGEENAQYAMEGAASRAGLFHHRQEKPHQPMYVAKPPDHLSGASQPQFPASHPQPISQAWPPENAMQDSGYWRPSYDQFMPS